jgi:hypothetical protein
MYDQGGKLTGPLMHEAFELISTQRVALGQAQLVETNDTVKHFIHALKLMVRKMMDECDNWDSQLSTFCFLAREVSKHISVFHPFVNHFRQQAH